MDLGQKLLQARLEAGMSQREVCGEEITRNMLSRIEHGAAKPSMATLRYLAQRLGKPVSWFLEDDVLSSPNRALMERARIAWQCKEWEKLQQLLPEFREPDQVYAPEHRLLQVLTLLELAEVAIGADRQIYARELLEKAGALLEQGCYCAGELQHRRLLLQGQLRYANAPELVRQLPELDEELLLRARAALEQEDLEDCARLLDAARDRAAPRWALLRGQVWLRQGDYAQAARCFHLAEEACPRQTARPLEQCYRELGDYRRAYNYACLERSFLGQGNVNER